MDFLPCSCETCLLLNCVAEAHDLLPHVKMMSVLSHTKENGRRKLVVVDFVVFVA